MLTKLAMWTQEPMVVDNPPARNTKSSTMTWLPMSIVSGSSTRTSS